MTDTSAPEIAKSYGDYLKIPELLGLQHRLTEAHDELQFIVVHQAFELWFKLQIFELESLRTALDEGDVAGALHYLRRVQAIIRMLTASFDVIETMRPYDFLQFRERLQPASGLQSLQFREMEFLCGLKDENYLKMWEGEALERLRGRAQEPSLWDAYLGLMERLGMTTAPHEALLESVFQIMREPDAHPLGHLTENLVEYDELFSLFRTRHLRMTMRMIGAKPGTGTEDVGRLGEGSYSQQGAPGISYLRTTLDKSFFPVLWEARTFMTK